ncbi:MAG: hypothetical protein JXQ75_09385 [Phycisphaerae bacterium]|nr:hypothetical protein [Phycisphaerae bacterium]
MIRLSAEILAECSWSIPGSDVGLSGASDGGTGSPSQPASPKQAIATATIIRAGAHMPVPSMPQFGLTQRTRSHLAGSGQRSVYYSTIAT